MNGLIQKKPDQGPIYHTTHTSKVSFKKNRHLKPIKRGNKSRLPKD